MEEGDNENDEPLYENDAIYEEDSQNTSRN
jgi:hypothetical protein